MIQNSETTTVKRPSVVVSSASVAMNGGNGSGNRTPSSFSPETPSLPLPTSGGVPRQQPATMPENNLSSQAFPQTSKLAPPPTMSQNQLAMQNPNIQSAQQQASLPSSLQYQHYSNAHQNPPPQHSTSHTFPHHHRSSQPTSATSAAASYAHHQQQSSISGSDQPSVNSNITKMLLGYFHRVSQMNEQSWLSIGRLSLNLLDSERAKIAFEQALKCNPNSLTALQNLAQFFKQRENFVAAIEYYQRILSIDAQNSDVLSSLAYCCLMQDDIQKAFSAYQQALYYAPNSKDPYLWYGLGILYERHGSDSQAEDFFISALRCDTNFEKKAEILYRLAVIYKNKKDFDKSLECFEFIVNSPPRPLTISDIRFQLGLLYEFKGDFLRSREMFSTILAENPKHIRTIQHGVWKEFNSGNIETVLSRITSCIEMDDSDPISWYILGRCYVAQRNFTKSCEAYQQAVLRNGKNPTFWCSIGLMYFYIQQYRDALDKFSKAIHLNSQLWEVWWNLGILYETCNNQISDAIASYKRALEVDPNNVLVHQRLSILSNYQQAPIGSTPLPSIPSPIDLPFSIEVSPPWQLFSKRQSSPQYASAANANISANAAHRHSHSYSQNQRIVSPPYSSEATGNPHIYPRTSSASHPGFNQAANARASIPGPNNARYTQMPHSLPLQAPQSQQTTGNINSNQPASVALIPDNISNTNSPYVKNEDVSDRRLSNSPNFSKQ